MKSINPITNKSTNIDDIPLKDRILEVKEFSEGFNPTYKMLSKIVDKDSENTITDKIKNTEVLISLKELFGVSPIVRKKISKELRVRREPNVDQTFIEDSNRKSDNSNKTTNSRNIYGNWNYFYLAAGSGEARGCIMGAEVQFLLDEGSEINIMNVDVYNALHSLKKVKINENIKSSIRDANKTIEIFVSVFVSNSIEPQVILGRSRERKARVMKDNRDDGTLCYTIKDTDTGAAATFRGVVLQIRRSIPLKNSKNTAFTLLNRIQAGWTAISKPNYKTEVNIRYKNFKLNINPAPHTLPSYSRKVFAFSKDEISLLKDSIEPPIKVITVPNISWAYKPYASPKGIWEQIKLIIKNKINQGILDPGKRSYGNIWFCIKKESEKLRFIQDVRPVNEVTIKNTSVSPITEEFSEDFVGRSIYTTFDLISGYDQIQISEESRDMFALQTPLGLLRMTRLPMGWSNSVQEFQRIMYNIFLKYIPEKLGLFIDDGCIKGGVEKYENLTNEGIRIYVHKHIDDVVEILTTLKTTGMTINTKKCRFGLAKVEVVGFVCSEEGRKPTESKINKILLWPRPRNIKELRGFLGLTCFYRVWIKSYSVIADPLYKLLRKDESYIWNRNQEKSFNTLKTYVSTAPILKAPNYTKNPGKFILTADASPVGAGGVLQQEDDNGDRKPCRFESYCFSARERRYSQIKRELFAMMKIIKKLRMYLYGVHFLLETDCRPLIGLLNKPDLPNDAASRWIGYILQFDFEISHIKGVENCVADAISRYSFPDYGSEILRINTILVEHSEFSKVEQ
ncbi:Retrovirus-related Pol polyprotein from transposon, partial [Smittium culicis]